MWQAEYEPFGRASVSINLIGNDFRFPGQYYDSESGLHYNWNRYYDPETGRYISADPIGLRGGRNYFTYVLNNPLNWIDPFGLWTYYGNWGGPNWTAGRKGSWDDFSQSFRDDIRRQIRDGWDEDSSSYRPKDAQDTCYMNHDICYGEARMHCKKQQDECFDNCERKKTNQCDFELAKCLAGIGLSGNAFDEARRIAAIPIFLLQPGVRNAINENKTKDTNYWIVYYF
ncbi:MAG: hypothetical protein CSA18_05215 [Deltaproteobacteria bacterium]|nr:MAG: hypothetical protein CSA18_05215 [Deltaproteobacteria bacterium]